jgi:hypothetical protein
MIRCAPVSSNKDATNVDRARQQVFHDMSCIDRNPIIHIESVRKLPRWCAQHWTRVHGVGNLRFVMTLDRTSQLPPRSCEPQPVLFVDATASLVQSEKRRPGCDLELVRVVVSPSCGETIRRPASWGGLLHTCPVNVALCAWAPAASGMARRQRRQSQTVRKFRSDQLLPAGTEATDAAPLVSGS